MNKSNYNDNVFINCPFDKDYKPLFDAMVFAVFDCGFIARCAKEEDGAGEIRIVNIYSIIADCRYGIHDISRTELDFDTNLPRFNMPLELGIFLGAKKFSDKQHKKKTCIILDKEPYRYQKFISDISGQDIKAHQNKPQNVIKSVRDTLSNASHRTTIPGGEEIWKRYQDFKNDLPAMCKDCRLNAEELTFNDYAWLVSEWLKVQSD